MKRRHEKAVHRRRRILFNNDGDDALYAAKESTPQGLLEFRQWRRSRGGILPAG